MQNLLLCTMYLVRSRVSGGFGCLVPLYDIEFHHLLLVFVMTTLKRFLNSNWFILLLIAVFALIGFSTVLYGEFLYDDLVLIVDNHYIRSFSNIPKFFVSNVSRGANVLNTNLYRPIVNIVHTVIYSMFELKVTAYHLTNIGFHVLNSFLAFLLLRRLGFWKIPCALAALIFVIHPIQSETVAYMAGLPDVIVTTFMFSGLLVFLKGFEIEAGDGFKRRRMGLLGMSALLLVLAFLTKELAVIFAPLVLLFGLYKFREFDESDKTFFKQCLAVFFAMTGVYLLLKFTVLDFTGGGLGLGGDNASLYIDNIGVRVITFFHMLPEYFRLIFWPVHLFFEKPTVAYASFFWPGIIGLLGLIGGCCLAVVSYFKRRIFMFGFGMFFIGLAPVCGVLIPANFMYADHWLYVPLVGVLVLYVASYGYLRSKRSRAVFVAVSLIIIALLTVRIMDRNRDWADPVRFFENEIEYYPSARTYNNLGYEYFQVMKLRSAVEFFYKAIEVDDSFPHPHLHMGKFHYLGGNTEEALNSFYRALEIDPNHVATLMSVKVVAEKLGRDDIANQIEALYQRIQNGEYITFEDIPGREGF